MKYIIVLILYIVTAAEPNKVKIEEVEGTIPYDSKFDCEKAHRDPAFRLWIKETYMGSNVQFVELKCRPKLPWEIDGQTPS